MVVVGNSGVSTPEAAAGRPDGKSATFGVSGVLVLAMGQGIQNQVGFDFNLLGTVSNGGGGGITVWAKDSLPWGGSQWFKVGIWAPGTVTKTGFDVGHVPFSGPSFSEIKLESTPGASAKLDAIEAINCKN